VVDKYGFKQAAGAQGCQMVSFQTKIPNLVKFWRAQDWKMLINFTAIWIILQTFGIFYDHLVHVVLIWYIFSGLGNIYREKSGNPAGANLQPILRSLVTYVCTTQAL
jgi:hypothetical protein